MQSDPTYDVPIPLAEIAYWTPTALLSTNGDGWVHNSETEVWDNYGPPGGGGIPTSHESMSGVRSMFGR